jgi:hypothetical protein
VLGFKELQQCCSSSSSNSAAGLLIHFSKAHHTSISRHLSQGLLRVQQSRRKDSDLLISASAKKHVKVSIVIQRERMTVDLGHEINAHMVFLFGCTLCSFC